MRKKYPPQIYYYKLEVGMVMNSDYPSIHDQLNPNEQLAKPMEEPEDRQENYRKKSLWEE